MVTNTARAKWLTIRILSQVRHSTILSFVAGVAATVALDHWFGSEWRSATLAAIVLILVVSVQSARRLLQKNRSADLEVESARKLTRPDAEAEQLAVSSHERRVVVGAVVELFVRRNLTAVGNLDDKGWAPSEVSFKRTNTKRNFDLTLAQAGGRDQSLRPPNSRKFGLAGYSAVTNDSDEQPEFTFYETDYYTQMSVYRMLPRSPQLRGAFGNLDPSMNRIPNAISLQSAVLFPEQELLCMLRRKGVDAEEQRWSISFEEQLKTADFEQMPACNAPEALFRRAFVEEVFGCKSDDIVHTREAWEQIERDSVLTSYRLWGLFYEVPVAHFQLLGFYRLNATPADLDKYHSGAKNLGLAGVDPEGRLFTLKREEWESLLVYGYGTASGLYGASRSDREIVRVEDLHRTSLYRLWRLAGLLGYFAPSKFDRHLTKLDLAAIR